MRQNVRAADKKGDTFSWNCGNFLALVRSHVRSTSSETVGSYLPKLCERTEIYSAMNDGQSSCLLSL